MLNFLGKYRSAIAVIALAICTLVLPAVVHADSDNFAGQPCTDLYDSADCSSVTDGNPTTYYVSASDNARPSIQPIVATPINYITISFDPSYPLSSGSYFDLQGQTSCGAYGSGSDHPLTIGSNTSTITIDTSADPVYSCYVVYMDDMVRGSVHIQEIYAGYTPSTNLFVDPTFLNWSGSTLNQWGQIDSVTGGGNTIFQVTSACDYSAGGSAASCLGINVPTWSTLPIFDASIVGQVVSTTPGQVLAGSVFQQSNDTLGSTVMDSWDFDYEPPSTSFEAEFQGCASGNSDCNYYNSSDGTWHNASDNNFGAAGNSQDFTTGWTKLNLIYPGGQTFPVSPFSDRTEVAFGEAGQNPFGTTTVTPEFAEAVLDFGIPPYVTPTIPLAPPGAFSNFISNDYTELTDVAGAVLLSGLLIGILYVLRDLNKNNRKNF